VAAGGIRNESVVRCGEVVGAEKKKKKEEKELAMSSRARSVTHLAGPPTSRVPPSYIAPFQQRKPGPHPSEEGRGSQPWFQVGERERRERWRRWWWWWERRERERSGVTRGDMRPKSPPTSLPHRRRPCARPHCMESNSCIVCAVYCTESDSCITHRLVP
jgi:hypothetical protein